MSETGYPFSRLEVVGYADSLDENLVPQHVAPIYGVVDEPDRYLMPPYRHDGERLVEFTAITEPELDRAMVFEQATRLDQPIQARAGHLLWIDGRLEPHYEAAGEARKRLRTIALDQSNEALRAVAAGRLGEASQHARIAVAADDRCLSAVLAKGLIYRIRGEEERADMLAEIAESVAPGSDFHAWIELFAGLSEKSDHSHFAAAEAVAEPVSSAWDVEPESPATAEPVADRGDDGEAITDAGLDRDDDLVS